MPNMQEITIIGHTGSDGELKVTNGGTEILSVGVAVNDKRTDKTSWYQIAIPGKFGRVMSDHLRKGQAVYASGDFSDHVYERHDGSYDVGRSIWVKTFHILDWASDEEEEEKPRPRKPRGSVPKKKRKPRSTPQPTEADDDPLDDDIPF